MIDSGNEALLSQVTNWFQARFELESPDFAVERRSGLEQFTALIHTLFSGDAAAASQLLDGRISDGAYMTSAVEALNNQQLSIRKADAGIDGWHGAAATQFNKYRGLMSTALEDCLAIAEGFRGFMKSFQSLVEKTHSDAHALLTSVKQAQDESFGKSIAVIFDVVNTVTDVMLGFDGVKEAAKVIGAMRSSASKVKDLVSSAQSISGLTPEGILQSAIDTAKHLQSANDAEVQKLNLMLQDLTTALSNTDELSVPLPDIVARPIDQGEFSDDDPNKVDLKNLDA